MEARASRMKLVKAVSHRCSVGLRVLCRCRSLLIGTSILVVIFLCTVLAPIISTYDPLALNFRDQLQAPSVRHFFGTDNYGRDIFSRVVYGARVSLMVGATTMVFTGFLGFVLGSLAGYYSVLDNIIMRSMDMLMALPAILLAIAIMAILGPSALNAVIALSIVYLPRTARIVRGSTLAIREQGFVEATRAVGAKDAWIIWRHVLPNCLAPLMVQQTVVFAYAVLTEAALSFLGVGAPPPVPSWGNILSEARALIRIAPWASIFPGVAIVLTVVALNLIGDGLRDQLDPYLKGRMSSWDGG